MVAFQFLNILLATSKDSIPLLPVGQLSDEKAWRT